jgi:preprotein translocase SecF subunit
VYDLIGKRNWFFAFSALITIPGLLFILLTPLSGGKLGLQFSIDYTGGTQWVIKFANPAVTAEQVKAVFVAHGYGDTVVVQQPNGFFQIRTVPLGLASPPPTPTPAPSGSTAPSSSPGPSASAAASGVPGASPSPSVLPSGSPGGSPAPSPSASPSPSSSAVAGAVASPVASPSASPAASPSPSASPAASPSPSAGGSQVPTTGPLGELARALQAQLGPISEQAELTTIGPVVSADLIQQAILLILFGALGILTWITIRFHDVKMGVTALVALLHDVIVVVGTFAILGTVVGLQIDALFVTAMLTVIGFSVHDTIVVFDRIRENRARHAGEPFDRIVNHSVLQTLGRSINTSFTVVLTLLALLLFGGSAIREFVAALLIGIVSGTYSSIFNASPLLVVWQLWEDRRRAEAAAARLGRSRA